MPDTPNEIRRINWTELFPFTQIFRTFKLAAQPSKLALALCIILGMAILGRVMDSVWQAAGQTALKGEIHFYHAARDFEAQRDAYARGKTDALVHLMTQTLRSSKTPEKIRTELSESRSNVLKNARNLLTQRYDKLVDLEARRKKEAKTLEKIPEEDREAQLHRMVAASRAEYAKIKHDLNLLKDRGIFTEWLVYESYYLRQAFRAARGLSFSSFYNESDFRRIGPRDEVEAGSIQAVTSVIGPLPGLSVAGCLCMMGRGVGWMAREHCLFAIFFLLGSLVIWAFFGGAICRLAALHAARDEHISLGQALAFSRQKLLGFVGAPIIVGVLTILIGLGLWIGGVLGSIPYVGEFVGGLLFALAIIGGAIIALLIIGLFAGGLLMWPTIAVEGSDSFDAISRSYSYVFARPWHALFYAAVASVYGGFCILFVRIFVWLTLACTHAAVGSGTGLLADRPELGPGANKLDVMWVAPQFEMLRPQAEAVGMHYGESVGSFFIKIWVYLVVCLIYAFAISFYFSGGTVIYYLLRHGVDATDYEEVYLEDYEDQEDFASAPAESGKPAEADESGADDTAAAESDQPPDS